MLSRLTRYTRAIAALLVLAAAACGGDSGDGPSGNPTGSIQVAANPGTLSLQQGTNGTVGITLTRGGGFSGSVNISLTGLPANVTAAVAPGDLTGTITNATVTVTAAANAAAGTYTITARATATGVGEATTTWQLTITPAPAYTLAVTPSPITAPAGGTANATVNITRDNFNGDVALSLVNPPAGITATFFPAPGGATAGMQVAVPANVPAGNQVLTIKGTAAGLTDRTVQVTVNVVIPTYTIALTPAASTIEQGASADVAIAINRTNFNGAVTFALDNPTGGITGTFAPNNTTGNTSTLTINVGANTAPGNYQLSLRGTAAGLMDRVAFYPVTVTAKPSGGNTEWQFCSAAEVPVFLAYQDGVGAWTRVTPTTNGGITKFAFNIQSAIGGVMWVSSRNTGAATADASLVSRSPLRQARMLRQPATPERTRRASSLARATLATLYETSYVYGTKAELATLGTDNCATTTPGKTITGTVAGVDAGQLAQLSLGSSSEFFVGGLSSPTVTFTDVDNGTVDFFGARQEGLDAPDTFLLFRNLNIPNGGALPNTIDFNGASAFAPATATATIANGNGEFLFLTSLLTTVNGQSLTMQTDIDYSPATQRTWSGIPANRVVQGDVFSLFVFASPDDQSLDNSRWLMQHVGQVGNQVLTMGPTLGAPQVITDATGNYPRLRVQGQLPAEYRQAIAIDISPGTPGNSVSITATGGWLAGVGSSVSYNLGMPDLTGMAGFPIASRLTAGTSSVSATAFGWTGSGILTSKPKAGEQFRVGVRTVGVNVP